MIRFNDKVQAALRHVHGLFPDVIQVFYGVDRRWMFCTEDFDAPNFDEAPGEVDVGILEAAGNAVDNYDGFPNAYRLLTLEDYYMWWDMLGDIPVSDESIVVIDEPFLCFPVGTPREEIWHWFEAQHPDFVVGEVMQGIRKTNLVGSNVDHPEATPME